ncbi:DUF47 domain-containing protein [Enterococcus columbae]|uniref:TIGR00153 family protein n=1 Tax=Enterococcus columbae DSM 7374 = ATCC 51263 TaxID=1121865 RepID=S0KID5_9ENTE|nr:DUF47 family protein [Enterococcus columbae]EOT44604.1 TIGR00153 family protein [Enterococcus columbae DSM 7374 = ATCC 51263]EOW87500.1 TIGR00153 family protein [Enterococcus columbae DSM 7374 = ATCC 51263]OJG25156.1 TIGR00153 family protein [Enterococcus columbae DSM 7374 = ATCC 51263]
MARRKKYDYFKTLETLAANSFKSAELLEKIMRNYSFDHLETESELIHHLEKENDHLVTELTNELYDAFITPIDREDIMLLAESLDDVLDGINGITYMFENLCITELRADTELFAHLLVVATNGVLNAMKEFPKFKNSKDLKQLLKEVRNTESEADRLYSKLKKELFAGDNDLLEIIKWKEIYEKFELISNSTEKAVDLIGNLIIKNT